MYQYSLSSPFVLNLLFVLPEEKLLNFICHSFFASKLRWQWKTKLLNCYLLFKEQFQMLIYKNNEPLSRVSGSLLLYIFDFVAFCYPKNM